MKIYFNLDTYTSFKNNNTTKVNAKDVPILSLDDLPQTKDKLIKLAKKFKNEEYVLMVSMRIDYNEILGVPYDKTISNKEYEQKLLDHLTQNANDGWRSSHYNRSLNMRYNNLFDTNCDSKYKNDFGLIMNDERYIVRTRIAIPAISEHYSRDELNELPAIDMCEIHPDGTTSTVKFKECIAGFYLTSEADFNNNQCRPHYTRRKDFYPTLSKTISKVERVRPGLCAFEKKYLVNIIDSHFMNSIKYVSQKVYQYKKDNAPLIKDPIKLFLEGIKQNNPIMVEKALLTIESSGVSASNFKKIFSTFNRLTTVEIIKNFTYWYRMIQVMEKQELKIGVSLTPASKMYLMGFYGDIKKMQVNVFEIYLKSKNNGSSIDSINKKYIYDYYNKIYKEMLQYVGIFSYKSNDPDINLKIFIRLQNILNLRDQYDNVTYKKKGVVNIIGESEEEQKHQRGPINQNTQYFTILTLAIKSGITPEDYKIAFEASGKHYKNVLKRSETEIREV